MKKVKERKKKIAKVSNIKASARKPDEKKGFLNTLTSIFSGNKSASPVHIEAVKTISKTPEADWEKLKNETHKIKNSTAPESNEKKQKKELKKKANKLHKEIFKKQKNKITISKDNKEIFLKTGVSGFDQLFENGYGIPQGAAVLVEGGPGSGKTLFCLTALANLCRQGKKGLFMSFEEREERLVQHMESFGWPASDYVKKGLLRIKRFDAIDVSRSVEALLSAAKKELLIEIDPVLFPKDFNPDFIVIDSLTSIASAFSGHESRFRIYMEQLFRYLEKNQITNFLIREVSSPSHVGTTFEEQGAAVSFLSDGIIVIYNVIFNSGKREAAIEILKMRGAAFKKRIVKMEVKSKGGVSVYPEIILNKTDKTNFELT